MSNLCVCFDLVHPGTTCVALLELLPLLQTSNSASSLRISQLNFSALCKHLGLSALRYTAHSHLVGPCVINNPHRNPQSSQAATFDQRESSDSAVCSGGGEFTPEIILDDHDGDISAKPKSYVSAIWWTFAALQ